MKRKTENPSETGIPEAQVPDLLENIIPRMFTKEFATTNPKLLSQIFPTLFHHKIIYPEELKGKSLQWFSTEYAELLDAYLVEMTSAIKLSHKLKEQDPFPITRYTQWPYFLKAALKAISGQLSLEEAETEYLSKVSSPLTDDPFISLSQMAFSFNPQTAFTTPIHCLFSILANKDSMGASTIFEHAIEEHCKNAPDLAKRMLRFRKDMLGYLGLDVEFQYHLDKAIQQYRDIFKNSPQETSESINVKVLKAWGSIVAATNYPPDIVQQLQAQQVEVDAAKTESKLPEATL